MTDAVAPGALNVFTSFFWPTFVDDGNLLYFIAEPAGGGDLEILPLSDGRIAFRAPELVPELQVTDGSPSSSSPEPSRRHRSTSPRTAPACG